MKRSRIDIGSKRHRMFGDQDFVMQGEVFMIRTVALVALVIVFLADGFGEENSRAVVFKGGLSYFVGTPLGGIGGSPSSTAYKIGQSFGVGVQFPRSEELSLLLMFHYSMHAEKPAQGTSILGNPKATIVDVTFSAKYGSGIPYFLGGIGYSVTKRDDATRVLQNGYSYVSSGDHQTMFILHAGFGAKHPVAANLSAFVEGTFRFRRYSSLAIEIGLAWKF
jgi:hypothetical protein